MYSLSNDQKQKILKNFKCVIDKRSSQLINKDLYYHLNLNCNFTAFFNLEGFRDAYSGDNFKDFIEQFDSHSPRSQWVEAPEISKDFEDINYEMLSYATEQAPRIYN
ncbi:MAG: hypothetical protein M0T74_05370 [Desulfitobacterium hafniense]|nr:hypothetical protein [Desulfitobacterium hafniense]